MVLNNQMRKKTSNVFLKNCLLYRNGIRLLKENVRWKIMIILFCIWLTSVGIHSKLILSIFIPRGNHLLKIAVSNADEILFCKD